MPGIPVRKVEKRDIPQLSEVLALAFDDDPAMKWATREDAKRLDALRDLYSFSIEGDLRYGEETATEDLRACAVWVPPEAREEKTPPLYTLRMLPRYIRWTGIGKLGRWLRFYELCEEKRPREPHFYLDFIGVHPEKHGQGYASALLRHTLTRLDAEGTPAYLESSNPRNNPLYQRHGFMITDEIHLPDGPTLWCMWRKPRHTTT
jgi:ribosomal protein S18 acetylase RimI-like enzyme